MAFGLGKLGYLGRLGGAGKLAFDYYVDSVNGSDTNNGTSSATAFQNLTALPAIVSGKRIGLAKGSTWAGGNNKITAGTGTPAANVTVGTYGSGAAPLIDCGDVVAAGNWTKTAGLTNVYNSPTVTFPAGNGGTSINTWINVIENGVFLQYVATQALCDSTVGSYTIADMTVTSGVIYIHSSSGIPTTNGKTYKYSARPWAIKIVGTSGVSVSGVTASLNGENDGSIILGGDGSTPTLSNSTMNLGGKHNAFLPGGGTCSGCTFNDAYYGNSGSSIMMVFFDGTGSGKDITVTNSTFNYGVNTVGQATINAISSHTNTGSLGAAITSGVNITSTSTVNGFNGIEPVNVTSMSVTGGVLQGLGEGIGMPDGITATINGTQYVSSWNQNHFIGPGNNCTVNVSNTLACVSNVQLAIFRLNNKTPVTLTLTNNLWYLSATQGATNEFVACTSSERLDVTANGNTFDAAISSAWMVDLGTNTANTFTGNNNHYHGASGQWYWHGATKTTLAAWQTATGQDANSDTIGSAVGACTVH